jgi:hypothetical protein
LHPAWPGHPDRRKLIQFAWVSPTNKQDSPRLVGPQKKGNFLIYFFFDFTKIIVEFNIGKYSLEPLLEMAVGFLPPFEEAVGSYRCGKRR